MINLKKIWKNSVYMLFDKFKFQKVVFYLFLIVSPQFNTDIQNF